MSEEITEAAVEERRQASAVTPPGYKWQVLATVVFGIFMIILDTTVVNVAFQTIRQEFGGHINDAQWVISVYVLSLGISTPLSGFLADRFGGKKIYLGALGLFALGSLLCGLSPSLPVLIAARAVQGVGGGIAMPLGTALLLQAFPVEEQGLALGMFGVVTLVAPAVGPILGGWLVDQRVWRVIFFINPPIGLIGVLLGIRLLRERRRAEKPPFDWGGVLTEMVGFGAILYAASIAADRGWTSPVTLTWFGVGAIGLILFVLNELYLSRAPLLDLRLFGNRIFLNASVLGYVATVALFGAEFLLPIYLQALRGLTALQTGLTLLPMAIAGGITTTLSGRIYDKVGPRPLMAVGYSLLLVNTWQLAQIGPETSMGWLFFLLALRGMSLGMTMQPTMVTALGVVSHQGLARGSSLTNATRLVVQSIGVAALATVLASAISPEIKSLQDQINAQPHAAGSRPVGICTIVPPPAPAGSSSGAGGRATGVSARPSQAGQGTLPPRLIPLVQRACAENISGFERAYKVTFFAAGAALGLGLLLPGWPAKWRGRRSLAKPSAASSNGQGERNGN